MIDETPPVVLLLVQPHNQADVSISKNGYVILGRERGIAVRVRGRRAWSGEGKELVGHDPIHVPILNLLEEVVRLDIEALPLKPLDLYTFLKSLQTVQDATLITAHSHCGVTEGQERRIDTAKRLKSGICALPEHNDPVGA